MAPREIDLELQRALEEENARLVRDLLSRKADPSAPGLRGQAPLELAVQKESLQLVRLLLIYQADPESLIASNSRAPKSEAAALVRRWSLGDVAAIFNSLEEVVIDAASEHDVSLLGLALASIDIAGGDAEAVATLQDARRNSVLHLCARGPGATGGGAEAAARMTARSLLGWGVAVDCANELGETPLLFAVRAMNVRLKAQPLGKRLAVPAEPARALLEARAEVEAIEPQSQETLLMLAAREGNVAAVRLLLEFQADPLRQNMHGKNAINLAYERPEVALLLRTALMTNKAGQSPEKKEMESPAVHRAGSVASESTPKVIHLVDQEELDSVQGVLNGVDLEEAYEVDWENPVLSLQRTCDPVLRNCDPVLGLQKGLDQDLSGQGVTYY